MTIFYNSCIIVQVILFLKTKRVLINLSTNVECFNEYYLVINLTKNDLTAKNLSTVLDGFRVASLYYEDPSLYLNSTESDFFIETITMNSPATFKIRLVETLLLYMVAGFGTGISKQLEMNVVDFLSHNSKTPIAVIDKSEQMAKVLTKNTQNNICIFSCNQEPIMKIGYDEAQNGLNNIKALKLKQNEETLVKEVTLKLYAFVNRNEKLNKPSQDKGFILEEDLITPYPITWLDQKGKDLIRSDKRNNFQQEYIVDVKIVRDLKSHKITGYKITNVYFKDDLEKQLKLNL